AIDQISVNIAPFDIRQSNFTGASVNAVTKSGDNTFKGSVYTYLRPESFAGKTVDGTKYEWDETSKQTYGLSLGGPIIKNKLFFFVNGEYEKSNKPSTAWKTSTDGNADAANYISGAKVSELTRLKQHLLSTYGYDPGDWNWKPLASENYKILARVDWNINDSHKLTVRYNQVVSTNDVLTNTNSAPTRLTQGRIGEYAMAFTNAGYGFENSVYSITGELNSAFGSRFSNKFLITYTSLRDKRTSPSEVFPFVDIMESGNIYTSFGYELYTFNNDVKNNTFSIIDNFTAYLGDHTVTAGLSYEQMYFGNAYMGFGTGYYQYNSINDFINNVQPAIFAQTVGLNGNNSPYSELSFGMGAFYVQDEWQLLSNLKLTGGIRFELPFYLNELQPNPAIADLTFADGYKMDVGTWAKQQLLISPRIAFNWDILKDGKYKVRGGTGIFTGRLPFVWFTNQPTQAGVLQFQKIISGTDVPADMRFEKDIYAQLNKYPGLFASTSAPSSPVEVSKDFKMPQIWRTNLAADVKLPWDMTFTLEGLYSKDINAILQKNVNEAAPNATFSGSDSRPRYNGISNKINGSISSAMVLGNTSEGYQYSITAQLAKDFSHGFTGAIAYTFSEAKDVTNNPGDQAASAWQSNVSVGSLNNPGLGYSYFSIPHRIIASLSYRFGYINSSSSTTISLFYEGAPQSRLNYVYSSDMNGDGFATDLMYIPKNENDIIFVNKSGMTAQEQKAAFFKFLEQDDYLSSHKGEYAQRFGAVMPWVHQFNLKLTQDFVMDNVHKTKIQLTLDVLNLGNLINSAWGVRKAQITGQYDNIPLLQYAGADSNNRPTFTLPTNSIDSYYTETYKNILDYTSTWSMQLGIRFIF
ncbi:MAG: cell envelope biogenesis protein OmpA, partial [Tannerella sp.]|nr:cell envelope biogenesis protein OmpA [Tannerella sp.]